MLMLSKCANPGCSELFRYLGEGRLFQVERVIFPEAGKTARTIEYYWLCNNCSRAMRIGILDNEAFLVFIDADGTVTSTTPIDKAQAA